MKHVIVIDVMDNVGNVIEDVKCCEKVFYEIDGKKIHLTSKTEIQYGFKVALRDIRKGSNIIKYKEVIGVASQDIAAGECVHVHNISGKRGRGDLEGVQS